MIYRAKQFTLNNGMNIIVKTPEIEDAEKLLKFIKKVCGETDYLLSTPEDMNITKEQEELFIKNNLEGPNYLLAVYSDNEIIGDCSLNFSKQIKLRHRGEIGIAIDKKYWGLGIGSILFEIMIQLAKEQKGIEQLNLAYLSNNKRGENLYKKYGFEITGIMPKALKQIDGSYADEVYMTKFLER